MVYEQANLVHGDVELARNPRMNGSRRTSIKKIVSETANAYKFSLFLQTDLEKVVDFTVIKNGIFSLSRGNFL